MKYFVNRNCGYSPKKPYQTYVWNKLMEVSLTSDKEIAQICLEAEREVGRGQGETPERMHIWLRSRHNKPIIRLDKVGEVKPEPKAAKAEPARQVGTVPLKLWPSTKPRVRVPRDEDRGKPTKELTVADKLDLVISILADIERKM